MNHVSNSRTTALVIVVRVDNRLAFVARVFDAMKMGIDRDGRARVSLVDQGSTDAIKPKSLGRFFN